MDKRKAPWRLSRGPNRFRALVRRLRFAASAGGAVLGHVVRTDVDSIGCGLFHELDAGCLGVGAGHTVGLTFGGPFFKSILAEIYFTIYTLFLSDSILPEDIVEDGVFPGYLV